MTTILVVDDEEKIIEILCRKLTAKGYCVESAMDSHSAIRRAHTLKPDIILLDYKLPGISGLAVQSALEASEITMNIPVIMMTGCVDDAIAEKVDSNVVKDYIIKPFDLNEVEKKIREVLAR